MGRRHVVLCWILLLTARAFPLALVNAGVSCARAIIMLTLLLVLEVDFPELRPLVPLLLVSEQLLRRALHGGPR